ncbi:hypothetical protein BGZ98_003217, partial [Dissophora globulifera]
LQGLQKIDFLAPTSVDFDFVNSGFIMSAVVDIHNPSNLTLHIGDLTLNAGDGTAQTSTFGSTTAKDVTLVPATWAFGLVGKTTPTPLYLFTLGGATSNEALNAGLDALNTFVIVPPLVLESGPTVQPYSNTSMSIKFLPTTVNDGLVEMTATFVNPYQGFPYNMEHATGASQPSTITYNSISKGGEVQVFDLLDDLTFSLSGSDETVTVTFKIQLHSDPTAARSSYQDMVNDSASGKVDLKLQLFPVISVGGKEWSPRTWTSDLVYPNNGGFMPFQTGADLSLILDWYDRQQVPVVEATPVATPSPTSTTDAVMPTSPASSPSPAATTIVDPAPPAITVV